MSDTPPDAAPQTPKFKHVTDMHIEDVTDATKARADAHPLKPHDRLIRLQYKGGTYHVKVRVSRHWVSSEMTPRLHMTASHAHETGKAKTLSNGKVDLLDGWQDAAFLGDHPGYDEDGDALPDHDPLWAMLLGVEMIAKRAVRAHHAFEMLNAWAGDYVDKPVVHNPSLPRVVEPGTEGHPAPKDPTDG